MTHSPTTISGTDIDHDALRWFVAFIEMQEVAEDLFVEAEQEYERDNPPIAPGDDEAASEAYMPIVVRMTERHPQAPILNAYFAAHQLHRDLTAAWRQLDSEGDQGDETASKLAEVIDIRYGDRRP